MDGAIHASESERPLIRTGPIELRDVGPTGRKLGTPDDCYDDSPWELHRGELVEKPMSYDLHSVAMVFSSTLFRLHARDGHTVMNDIYCVLDDEYGQSLRAPDTVLVKQVVNPKNEPYPSAPIIAVEIRATQSKKNLQEKVALYLEHDWPTIWIVHTERHEVEVVQKGLASVMYRPGSQVPLPPELDKYGLKSVPVTAFFDDVEAVEYTDGWVHARGIADGRARERANSLLDVLLARGFDVPARVRERIQSCSELDLLQRWFTLAVTASNTEAFVKGLD
jgi:Uma2 family endonuclease